MRGYEQEWDSSRRKVMNKTCCRYSFWDTALHTLHGITDNLTDLRSLLGLDQDLSPENSTKNVEIGADKPEDTEADHSKQSDSPNTQLSYAVVPRLYTDPTRNLLTDILRTKIDTIDSS